LNKERKRKREKGNFEQRAKEEKRERGIFEQREKERKRIFEQREKEEKREREKERNVVLRNVKKNLCLSVKIRILIFYLCYL